MTGRSSAVAVPAVRAVPSGTPAMRRAVVRSAVAVAARVLPVHYPLETFIAVNPLAGLEHQPFEQALRTGAELFGAAGTLGEDAFRQAHAAGRITDADLDAVLGRRYLDPGAPHPQPGTGPDLAALRADLLRGQPAAPLGRRPGTRSEQNAPQVAAAVDAHSGQWCSAYLTAAHTPWAMPGWEQGFYPAWRALAGRDRSLPDAVRAGLHRAPERADDAVLAALERLGVPEADHVEYLRAHLTRQPGFAAHVRWCAEHGPAGIDLVEHLAVRLNYEALLLEAVGLTGPPAPVADVELGQDASAPVTTRVPPADRAGVWLAAYEEHYRAGLLAQLDTVNIDTVDGDPVDGPAAPANRPAAQVVCCIDTRSEGLRRHLEASGDYETLGFAGFFAVAIRYTDLAGGAANALCPVLIAPSQEVDERPAAGAGKQAARRIAGLAADAGAWESFHAAKEGLLTPFALAEGAGWIAGPVAGARTFLPRWTGRLRARLRDRVAPAVPTELEIGFTFEEAVLFAEVALTTMGLVRDFARLVVLCGHGSTSENNPYQASLDCGACGGQRGGPNARTAARILSSAVVREGLRERGIDLPDDTVVIAAEHDTTLDEVVLLDPHLVPDTHARDVAALAADLARATAGLAVERATDLPGGPRARTGARVQSALAGRSADWAQVYPEWGLAGNAAFVVGPRALSKGLDLQRRVFLHSYEASVDPDGSALETILTAPMVVAQWINSQYYFSAVDPEVFGSGTKTVHNVLGGVGVLAGHDGDLQLGLPWQSVGHGTTLVHEPMRLLTVVHAPRAAVRAVIDRNPVLQRLFGNEWVALVVGEPGGGPWYSYTRDGWITRTETPPHHPEETP